MAKSQQRKPVPQSKQPVAQKITTENAPVKQEPTKVDFSSFRVQAIIIAVLSIVFYANTFRHEYAFDDMMAIVSNQYVQDGAAGIGKIMTSDAYQSYLEQKNGGNQLAGGRYRPLSLVTFAFEQQILGLSDYDQTNPANGRSASRTPEQEEKLINDMHFRHVVDVFLYALCCVLLLAFLRKVVFPDSNVAAFAAAFLFAIHPLHTEVVANVKSRDEILSVIFICCTFLLAFKYKEQQTKKYLYQALACYFLALLSKEYALTLVVLLPMAFYIFRKETLQQSFRSFLPYLVPLGVYMLMRVASVNGPQEGAENDIMNYPYLYATVTEAIATKLYVLLQYIKLLFFPYPLSADYSFRQIPYTTFTNPQVIMAIIAYAGIAILMIRGILQRNRLAFALAFFLFNLLLISNFIVNIGAPMGERLVFHSSIGFVMAISCLIPIIGAKLSNTRTFLTSLTVMGVLLTVISGYATITRNADWKNNTTLFLHDVKIAPNSALVNNNAGSACMGLAKTTKDTAQRRQWMLQAIPYFDKVLIINPKHILSRLNRGLCYFNAGFQEKALADWDTVRANAPGTQNLNYYLDVASHYFFARGMELNNARDYAGAAAEFSKAAKATPNEREVWNKLAEAYQNAGLLENARQAYARTIVLSPNNDAAKQKLDQLNGAQH